MSCARGQVSTWAKRETMNIKTHSDDLGSSCLCCKHTEDASSAADVENILALEELRVLEDRVLVCRGADCILQHLLVDACDRSIV